MRLQKTTVLRVLQRIVLCVMVIVPILIFLEKQLSVRAGFGDFNDYDSYDSYDSYDYDSYDSYDYDSYDSYDSSGGSGDPIDVAILYGVLAVVIVFCFIKSGKRQHRQQRPNYKSGYYAPLMRNDVRAGRLTDRTAEIEDLIKRRDPYFSAYSLIAYVKKVYLDIQDAWCKRDLTPVRRYLHEDLYAMTERQIKSKIEKGVKNNLENICVNTTYLSGYRQDGVYEYLTVYLYAQMIDYQYMEDTGEIIRGDRDTRWNMYYRIVFSRSLEVLTPEPGKEEEAMNCPNCGAALGTGSGTVCPYCGSLVTQDNHGWILQEFGVIKPDTVDEGIV